MIATLTRLRLFWTGSIRRRMMIGVGALIVLFMLAFVFQTVEHQRLFLAKQNEERGAALVDTLAVHASSGILTSDEAVLGELVASLAKYPDLRYAMLLAPDGRVLAHSDQKLTGRYAVDAASLALLRGPRQMRVVARTAKLIDVAAPILVSGHLLGWARVGLGQDRTTEALRRTQLRGFVFAGVAVLLGLLLASAVGRNLSESIGDLVQATHAVAQGNAPPRHLHREDELGALYDAFDAMAARIEEGSHKLRANEKELRQLLATLPVPVLVRQNGGAISYANAEACKRLGIEGDDWPEGRTVIPDWHFIRQDGSDMPREELPSTLACRTKQAVHSVIVGLLTRDTVTPRWLLVSAHPELDSEGEVRRSVITFLDVSEQKEVQEQLHRRAEEFRALVENAPNPILRYDRNCNRVYVNPALARMAGKAVTPLLGSQSTDGQLLAPEEGAKLRRWVQEVIDTGVSTEGTVDFHDADGRIHYMHVRNVPERDTDGRVATVLSISTDVTSVVEAELRLRGLVDNLPDLVMRFDPDGRFIYVNPLTERTFGRPPEFFLGKTLFQVLPPSNEVAAARMADSVQQVLVSGKPHLVVVAIPVPGGLREFEMRHLPEKDAMGKIVSVLGIARDVTERNRAEATQRRLYRELKAIGECNQALVRAEDEKSLLHEICRIVCEEAGYLMAWVGYAEDDEAQMMRPVAWAGFEDGYLTSITPSWADPDLSPSGGAISTGETESVQDIATEPVSSFWREEALQRGYRSMVGLPLKDEHGNTYAALIIYSGETYAFTPDEIRLLEELAADLAFGIRVLRARTGLRLTAEMLRKSEEEFRTLTETLPDPVIRYDRDGKRIYMNPTAVVMAAGAKKPLLDRRPTESWPGSTAMSFYEEKLREVVGKDIAVEFEFNLDPEYAAPALQDKVLKMHIVPEHGPGGKVTGALAIGRDITELKQREQHYREIFNNVSEGMYLLEAVEGGRFRFLEVNEALARSTGITMDAMVGKCVDEIMPPDVSATLAALANNAMNAGALIHADAELDLPSGHRYYSSSFIPVRNTAGRITRVVAISRDVTERREYEEKVRQLSAAVEQSPVSVFITNPRGEIRYVNPAFTSTTGYTQEEVLGKNPRIFSGGRTSAAQYSELWATIKSGRSWHGTLQNRRKDGTLHWVEVIIAPIRDGAGQIERFVAIEQDITARKAAEERVEYLAHHDSLTGLPNRLLGKEYMEAAMANADREGRKAALIFLDLDGFKRVNDSLGHGIGDGLLVGVAGRLKQLISRNCMVARQGGDEFLMILSDIGDPSAVSDAAAGVLESLSKQFSIDGHELSVSASLGIAVYPDDGADWDTLFKKADIAMYSAKETCRNTFRFFAKRMNVDADDNLRLHNKMQAALQRGELMLYYQPKINLKSGKVAGMEALLRWNSPEMGMVSPARFIPLAEDSGLIVPIGEWALREACRQAARWNKSGLPRMVMAVNLSAVQFRSGNVLGTVVHALAESGLEPGLLELEMTESIVMKDTENMLALINRLKGLGVSLSIDDFGTGFSGLSYLKRFNADKVKIDQSFVRDIATDTNSAAIVTAIVQMARTLGMMTVAEGVDDARILEMLRQRGCDEAQGFFFAQPLPPESVPDFLTEFRQHRDQYGFHRSARGHVAK